MNPVPTITEKEAKGRTSGPASAQASSEVKRTTESWGSSSEVCTTVVIWRLFDSLRTLQPPKVSFPLGSFRIAAEHKSET